MNSTSNRSSLSLTDIDGIVSIIQAYEYARRNSIQIPDDVKSVAGIIRVLKQALGITRPLALTDLDAVTAAKQEDAYNREKLGNLYLRAGKYISDLPSTFRNDLDLYFPGYNNRLKSAIEDLKTSQCVLLVAGEMGSGKSSLVNLLLGLELMPTSELQCTAAIVEISYGPTPKVTAHYLDDSLGRSKTPIFLQPEPPDNIEKFLAQVKLLVSERDEQTDESPFEKVQLQWPIEMLQGGVTIVDSPGVGGNKGFPQVLSSYLDRAFGFMYVMDSTASIHKHRLGQLLLKAIEANGEFDHSTTIFVCNHWDQVPPADAERVIDAMRSRLGMIIPGARKIQLYPISVKESAKDVKYGQIAPQHQHLVEGIRKFLPQTMRGKLRIYYRYLSSVLKRVLLSLQISYNINKDKMDEIRSTLKDVEDDIYRLQKNPKERLDKIKLEMEESRQNASRRVLEHLESMYTRTKMARWQDRECPNREKTWQNNLKSANAVIAERVAECINTWEKTVQFVNTEETRIIQLFKEQFKLFDDQLKQLEGARLHGNDVRKFLIEGSGKENEKRRMKEQKLNMDTKDSFLSIGAAITSSFSLNPKDPRVKDLFKNRYKDNPPRAMQEATDLYLNMIRQEAIADAMRKYFNRLLEGIDRVGSMVPDMVKADQKMLAKLNEELKAGSLKLLKLPGMAQSCTNIQGDLDMFYVQRLIVSDFTPDQIIYGECLGVGTFAKVYKGTLHQGHVTEQVALKEPINSLKPEEVTDVLLEEFMLRDLKHRNIIKYYGMCKTGTVDNIKLIFVMEYCPFTLKKKCVEVENSPSRLGNNTQKEAIMRITRYMIQICRGLAYLHHKFIVHRDLKPENVLLNVEDEVRIADFGLAQKVKDIVAGVIGTPIYIAPEVLLLNDKYDTKIDIYSLAMTMWEIWYGKDLSSYARSEIQDGLKNAIAAGWRPSLTMVQRPPTLWAELIRTCWDQDPKNRPTVAEVGRMLELFYEELQE